MISIKDFKPHDTWVKVKDKHGSFVALVENTVRIDKDTYAAIFELSYDDSTDEKSLGAGLLLVYTVGDKFYDDDHAVLEVEIIK